MCSHNPRERQTRCENAHGTRSQHDTIRQIAGPRPSGEQAARRYALGDRRADSLGAGVQDTAAHTRPHKAQIRSTRIADCPTLTCPPRAIHITRRAIDLQNQTAQMSGEFEPNEVHGYTGCWASGARQSRSRETGTGGALGASALRALMQESAGANRARLIHLYVSTLWRRPESADSEALRDQHLRRADVDDQCTGGRGGMGLVRHAHPPVLQWPLPRARAAPAAQCPRTVSTANSRPLEFGLDLGRLANFAKFRQI